MDSDASPLAQPDALRQGPRAASYSLPSDHPNPHETGAYKRASDGLLWTSQRHIKREGNKNESAVAASQGLEPRPGGF